jgi:hypothetical protein
MPADIAASRRSVFASLPAGRLGGAPEGDWLWRKGCPPRSKGAVIGAGRLEDDALCRSLPEPFDECRVAALNVRSGRRLDNEHRIGLRDIDADGIVERLFRICSSLGLAPEYPRGRRKRRERYNSSLTRQTRPVCPSFLQPKSDARKRERYHGLAPGFRHRAA